MVSNGTGQCNFSGERGRNYFIVPGQRDNGTSSKSCRWPGRAGTASQNLGRVLILCHGTGRDGILKACPIPSWTIPGQPPFLENLGLFWTFFVPGHPGTEKFFPGFLLLLLSRDKGTTGRPVLWNSYLKSIVKTIY